MQQSWSPPLRPGPSGCTRTCKACWPRHSRLRRTPSRRARPDGWRWQPNRRRNAKHNKPRCVLRSKRLSANGCRWLHRSSNCCNALHSFRPRPRRCWRARSCFRKARRWRPNWPPSANNRPNWRANSRRWSPCLPAWPRPTWRRHSRAPWLWLRPVPHWTARLRKFPRPESAHSADCWRNCRPWKLGSPMWCQAWAANRSGSPGSRRRPRPRRWMLAFSS